MKKLTIIMLCFVVSIGDTSAFEVKKLSSNKEAFSRELTKQDSQMATNWSLRHRLGAELKSKSLVTLASTFNEMERVDTTCELGLISSLTVQAFQNGVIEHEDDMSEFVTYLRHQDLIDDILFRLMKDSLEVKVSFNHVSSRRVFRPRNASNRQNASVDLQKFYAPVKTWPDDITSCTLDTYWKMAQGLSFTSAIDRDVQLTKLNYLAYSQGVIDQSTYGKLEILREKHVSEWPVYFKRYADLINNAKDKMTKSPEEKSLNSFSVEYVTRKDKMTQRGLLYRNYSSTQVMILAQVIEKTAKRMDAKFISLNWQYSEDPQGETEIYVLSPMEQYRVAIKMLRKDLAEIMRSDAFKNTGVQYEHLISAAYETGYIKSQELDQILKFEDFWNPRVPRWKAYANFAMTVAGSTVVYLPPPWNIIGAVGLVVTQATILKTEQETDPDDNWNVII